MATSPRSERRRIARGYATPTLLAMLMEERRDAAFPFRSAILSAVWCGVIRAELHRRHAA